MICDWIEEGWMRYGTYDRILFSLAILPMSVRYLSVFAFLPQLISAIDFQKAKFEEVGMIGECVAFEGSLIEESRFFSRRR